MVVIKRRGDNEGNNLKELKVNRKNIENALIWLCRENKLYRDHIKIDWDMIKTLPENGFPSDDEIPVVY